MPKRGSYLSLVHAGLVFLALVVLYNIWIQHAFQGQYWENFLPGANFGIPSKLKEMGMYTVGTDGYDAQFYYYQSNDLLGNNPDYTSHIDAPSYRYQRIGVPIVAHLVSAAIGYTYTSPIVYNVVQIFFVALGFFFLILWLSKHGLSQIYAYGWLLSVGVINALCIAMPDPVGDALFIIAMVFALEKRLTLYAISACVLILVREVYIVFAGVLFLLTFFNKIYWRNTGKVLSIGITGVPVLIYIIWIGYISLHFGHTPMEVTKGWGLTDWPLYGMIKALWEAVQTKNLVEIKWKIFETITLFVAALAAWESRKTSPIWYAVIAYILLMFCLGEPVWIALTGYTKALGTAVVVIVMSLPFLKQNVSTLLKVFLIITAILGVHFNYRDKTQAFYDLWTLPTRGVSVPTNPSSSPLLSYSSQVKAINVPSVISTDRAGLFGNFRRKVVIMTIKVTNTSHEVWKAYPVFGLYAINASYHWLNPEGTEVLVEGMRTPIGKNIEPGESRILRMRILVPTPGTYLLRIEMMQEGVAWFGNNNPESYISKIILIK